MAALSFATSGCNLNHMMANSVGDLSSEAGPNLKAHWDAELALDGVPSNLMQLEGLLLLAPANEGLNLQLARAYIAYGYARVELDYEQQLAAGDADAAAHQRQRAELLYSRARSLGLAALRAHDDDVDAALEAGPGALAAHLRDAYPDTDELDRVYVAAEGWAHWVRMLAARGADVRADAQMAATLAEHVARVEPGFAHGGALALLGRLTCNGALSAGDELERGNELFERAFDVTARRVHAVHIHYARSCVLRAGERERYVALMREVLAADDAGDAVRLPNKFARKRAEWYVSHVPQAFGPQ